MSAAEKLRVAVAVAGGGLGGLYLAQGLRAARRPLHLDERAAARAARGCRRPGRRMMWAVAADHRSFPVPDAALADLDPGGLHDVASQMIRMWHRDVWLVALADVGQTFGGRVSASVSMPQWPPGRVTVLGDAIHAMSPASGSGANAALQDAGVLCRVLTDAGTAGWPGLLAAVGDYETQMREYGYAAVQASRRAEAGMGAGGTRSPPGSIAAWHAGAKRLADGCSRR